MDLLLERLLHVAYHCDVIIVWVEFLGVFIYEQLIFLAALRLRLCVCCCCYKRLTDEFKQLLILSDP